MGLPQVVIVGRPNVGKSSILNWLAQKRLAIVDHAAGITRDRLTYLMCHRGHYFELVDTGGIGFEDPDNLTGKIEDQITAGIDSASVVLFVVDTRSGLIPLDQEVAQRLRYVDVPVVCVANKTDEHTLDSQADEFYRLGRGKLIRVSTLQNRGRQELLDMIVERLPAETDEQPGANEPIMKVAIVGRRNVGKSTFVNTLAQAERMIVSEVPGTTRDSVDVRFELDGKSFVAIDTPGLRRTKSMSDIDFYSAHRAQRSIRRADVVLIFFDPSQRISKVDKQLCDYIAEQYKTCIFVINKGDLLAGSMPTEKWVTYLRDTFRTMWHAPIAFVTGQTGKNVKALLNHGQMLFKQARARLTTGELNRVLRAALERNPPPLYQNRQPKIYYATQVGIEPPTIVMFCNDPQALSEPYRRYLLGILRDQAPFAEVPIKLYLRKRQSGDQRDEIEMAGTPPDTAADNTVAQNTGVQDTVAHDIGDGGQSSA
jgi:GTPase